MFTIFIRILFGYAVSVVAATTMTAVILALMTGGWSMGWRDIAAGTLIIGLMAWGGLLFAIRGEMAGWSRLTTYVTGGLLAMLASVATVTGLGVLQGLAQGFADWDVKHAVSFVRNVAELLLLGIIPGIAGGLTYWLVSVSTGRKRPV